MKICEVAEFFLTKQGMTNKKIQKLCYYAQAWFYALYNRKLFDERIEAWVHGPVCPILYKTYAEFGYKEIPKIEKKINMQENERSILEQVWNIYGGLDGDELEILTHREKPWLEARNGIDYRKPSNEEILPQNMGKYYREKYGI
jgi:uncharacterized phage-associated protein